MNTEILLVRHGETEWNTLGKFQGCKDIALSNNGIYQASFLKKRFENGFHCIYTSPLIRAIQTAKIISEDTDMIPIISDELREINFGKWEGLTLNQIEVNYTDEFNIWKTDEINGNLVGGDISLRKASIRAKNEILKIVKKNIGKKIIIVCHGGIIKAGLIGIFNWKMTMYHKLILGNTAVSKLYFDEAFNPILATLNDTSHLPVNNNLKSFV